MLYHKTHGSHRSPKFALIEDITYHLLLHFSKCTKGEQQQKPIEHDKIKDLYDLQTELIADSQEVIKSSNNTIAENEAIVNEF